MAANYVLDPPKISKTKPITSDQIKDRDFLVEDGKFHKVTYQVGPYIGGPAKGSNRWPKRHGAAAGEPDTYDPEHLVYDETVSTEAVNGLIAEQKEWVKRNSLKVADAGRGRLGDMIAVLHVEEAKDFVPPRMSIAHTEANMMAALIGRIIDEKMAALTGPSKTAK